MSSTYYLPTRLQLCAFACLALGGLLIAAPGDDAKIETTLLAQLTSDEEATANFFVVFGDQPDLSQAENIKDKAARGKFVGLALKNTADRSQNGVRGYLQGKKIAFTAFWIENKIFVPNGTLELARDLSKRKEVVAIIPEVIYSIPQPQGAAAIQSGTATWGIKKINADQVWATTTGVGIVVANVDTGVQFDHPALVSHYRGNNGGIFTHTGNWYDPTGTSPSTPADNVGHGSHTMGTMVGSDGVNLIGVAPGAKWIACKGCASNSCSGSNLISCAQWMIDPMRDNSMANQPDVVNNSWGGGSGDTWYQSYINNWRTAGIFPAFSAGNSGSACGTANSPGDNTTAFASGATDSNDVIASFSSRGPSLFGGIKPDVSAPGVSVLSSVPTNAFSYYSGTSMASPHTAGAVALLWAAEPQWRGNISGTEQLLRSTATKLTSLENCGGTANLTPNDTFGYGRIDLVSLINGAGGATNQPPTVSITAPVSGTPFNCSVPVSFTGVATDHEDGDAAITSKIVWKEGTSTFPTMGGSASKSFDCTLNASELHTISASVTDTGGASASANVTITIVNPAVPAAPTGLTASVVNKLVTLNWKSSGPVTGFRVERKGNGNGGWTLVVLSDDPTLRTITNNATNGNWQYRVFAKNTTPTDTLWSASSNIVSVKIR